EAGGEAIAGADGGADFDGVGRQVDALSRGEHAGSQLAQFGDQHGDTGGLQAGGGSIQIVTASDQFQLQLVADEDVDERQGEADSEAGFLGLAPGHGAVVDVHHNAAAGGLGALQRKV